MLFLRIPIEKKREDIPICMYIANVMEIPLGIRTSFKYVVIQTCHDLIHLKGI